MSRLTLIFGPMFSGKSSYLIKEINKFKNKELLLSVNHKIDNRYDNNKIVNHNKLSVDCLSLNKLNDIYNYNINFNKLEHLFIDESQFFNDLEYNVKHILNTYPKLNITCAGLDGDYKQNLFYDGQLLHLIPYADNVIKLYSKCYECGKKAPFTKKIYINEDNEDNEDDDGNEKQIVVGSSDIYQPSCYIHK